MGEKINKFHTINRYMVIRNAKRKQKTLPIVANVTAKRLAKTMRIFMGTSLFSEMSEKTTESVWYTSIFPPTLKGGKTCKTSLGSLDNEI